MGRGAKSRSSGELASAFRALSHPLRIEIISALENKPQSASEFSDEGPGRAALGTISHHFRALERAGLIELDSTEQRRGALMRSYRLTKAGRRSASWVRQLA